MALKVCESFYSLMGESTRVGLPAFFIRLSGCNLRCGYCDTAYAYAEGREVATAELLAAAGSFSSRLVLVTGGEPLLQEETLPLLTRLGGSRPRGLPGDQRLPAHRPGGPSGTPHPGLEVPGQRHGRGELLAEP